MCTRPFPRYIHEFIDPKFVFEYVRHVSVNLYAPDAAGIAVSTVNWRRSDGTVLRSRVSVSQMRATRGFCIGVTMMMLPLDDPFTKVIAPECEVKPSRFNQQASTDLNAISTLPLFARMDPGVGITFDDLQTLMTL